MEKILNYLNNYFYRFGEKGTYNITSNTIEVRGTYLEGQYIRLTGSILNDGVFKVINVEDNTITIDGAVNEVFEGCIYSLAVPKEITELEKQINKYEEENQKGGYASESFGNYSYTKAQSPNGGLATWKDVFRNELKPYRKIIDGIKGVKMI